MLTSAPFDDWWHNTYGLDVKILSPPHAVLAAGIGAIQIGAMLMALAWQNRSAGRDRKLQALFIYGAGLLLLNGAVLSTEYIQRWDMHQSLFYQVVCSVFPFFLVSAARASAARWPATLVACVYTAISFVMIWMLPLFEGRPLLGPIYVQLDRFLPPDPPLLADSAGAGDRPADALVRHARATGASPRQSPSHSSRSSSPCSGRSQTSWSRSWARNWVFGTHYMAYMIPPDIQARWFQVNPPDSARLPDLPIAARSHSSRPGADCGGATG